MQDKIEIKKSYAFILLVLLLTSFIVLIDVFVNKNRTLKKERDLAVLYADSILSEKLLYNKQIDDANLKFNQCIKEKEEAVAMNALLNDAIKAKTGQLEKLAKDNSSVAIFGQQIKESRKQKEDCESRMIFLTQQIKELEDTLDQLDRQLTEFKSENESMKKKLEWAADIKARTISVKCFYLKEKPKETNKANKVNRITVTMDLMENQVAEPGSKKVYMVVSSGSKILSETAQKFTEKNSKAEMYISAMKEINFNNSGQKVIVNYDFKQKLSGGKYKVKMYIDGSLAGQTDFLLK